MCLFRKNKLQNLFLDKIGTQVDVRIINIDSERGTIDFIPQNLSELTLQDFEIGQVLTVPLLKISTDGIELELSPYVVGILRQKEHDYVSSLKTMRINGDLRQVLTVVVEVFGP